MTRFYPLYVRRSDGKLQVTNSKKTVEKNEPSPDQLDRTPDAKGVCDYYREIAKDETKHMDWRRKLAGMLIRELGGKEYEDRATTSILETLPENYRLYEHIKSRTLDKDGNPQKSTKTHAGGGHDRQDAYLYGHPLGPKKRYRSPADFFPHLLWLVTDEAGDYDNCSCKICCPEELEEKNTAPKEYKTTMPATKKDEPQDRKQNAEKNVPLEPINTQSVAAPLAKAKSSTPVGSPATKPQVTARPQAPPGPSTPTQTPLPQPRSNDQQLDAQYGKFTYRPGEVIWFYRGAAWGLGVVTRRYQQPQNEARGYIVQPLSHPRFHPDLVTVVHEEQLRPWLAWSPPGCTYSVLQEQPMTYDVVDWEGLINGRYGSGDPEVDGSILAAKAVDNTYSPFDFVRTVKLGNERDERHWNGIFIGCEKLWVGEPARLRPGSGTDVLVIVSIVERTRSTVAECVLVGDIYTLAPFKSNQQEGPNDRNIPLRMRQDLHWRNTITSRARGSRAYWKLLQSKATLEIGQIKGRWYESSIMMPILMQQQRMQTMIAQGDVGDTGQWMNARGDSNPANPLSNGVKRNDRRSAFGKAVPAAMRIVDGTDPPLTTPQPQQQQNEQDRGQQQRQLPAQSQQQSSMPLDSASFDTGQGAIEEFMNLDGMENDGLQGIGGDFGNQDSTHGFF